MRPKLGVPARRLLGVGVAAAAGVALLGFMVRSRRHRRCVVLDSQ